MISVVIPTCKLENLKLCLESIVKYTDRNGTDIIIVSNGSPDSISSYIKTFCDKFDDKYSGIRVLEYKERIGFTRAVNEGIKVATGEYIVILNDDVVLLPQVQNAWLDIMKLPFMDDKVGITGPLKGWSNEVKKNFMIFFCVMIPRKVLDDVGLLDEVFNPGFGEDIDWCLRAEKKGYRIAQVPTDALKQGDKLMVGNYPIYHAGHKTMDPSYDKGIAKNITLLQKMYPVEEEIDGFLYGGEKDYLKREAAKHTQILEIGSWHGKSTRILGKNTPGCVYAVDTWDGTPNEMQWHGSARLEKGDHAMMFFWKNNGDLIDKGKIIPMRMDSGNACRILREQGMKFDMIFIDGDHTYEGVKKDILNTKDLLAEGGLLCGHDYNQQDAKGAGDTWAGVKQAVDELVGSIKTDCSIWYKVKDKKLKITDCVVFFNENDLLDVRLQELAGLVDEHIVVESKYTFSGHPKPLNFDKERFKDYPIKYVVLDNPPQGDWARENWQRMQIQQHVSPDTDIVISTDIDEIPNAETVRNYRPEMGLRYLDMRLYYYWINCYVSSWFESKIIGYKDYMKMTPVQVRNTNCPKLEGPLGWHFSYLGGVDAIIDKIRAYAHQEFNRPDILDRKWIEQAINEPTDVLKRPWVPSATETERRDGKPCHMRFVGIDATYPKYIRDNLAKFRKMGWIKCGCKVCPKTSNTPQTICIDPRTNAGEPAEQAIIANPAKQGEGNKQLTNASNGVTAVVCTRSRYDTTLSLCLSGIIQQSFPVEHILIYDDTDKDKRIEDLRVKEPYKQLFGIMSQKGITFQVIYGNGDGQVRGHKISLREAKTKYLWRVDDDCVPEATCLERLMLVMEADTDIGACGGLVLDAAYQATSKVASSKIQDIYMGFNVQWFTHTDKRPYEVDHLYSTFLYKRGVDYYPSNLSRVGHREETIATYRMKRAGMKLWVVPEAVTWHLKGSGGGIRDGHKEQWDTDEAVFAELMRDWGVETSNSKVITLDNGIGDHYAFKTILPEVMARYPNLILACCYPAVFHNVPSLRLISIAEAYAGGKRDGVYRFMFEHNWKKGITDAYRELYLS